MYELNSSIICFSIQGLLFAGFTTLGLNNGSLCSSIYLYEIFHQIFSFFVERIKTKLVKKTGPSYPTLQDAAMIAIYWQKAKYIN